MSEVHQPAPPLRTSRRRRTDRGASLVEYALLLVLITLVVIGALEALGSDTSESVDDSASSLASATN